MAKNGSIGFEKELWNAADQLRSHMDAAVYKHVALGLLFLKYVNDKFDEARSTIEATPHADAEDEDEYFALNAFWVPEGARWEGPKGIKANATQDDIGVRLNRAVEAIEAANDPLQGVVPREFANEDLSAQTLAGLISTFDRIQMRKDGEDTFGRVYEYFLGEFARAEGKKGGQFFTPQSVVKTLVAMLEPYKGRIYDPCCGSGGMFIQSQEFVTAHGGKLGQLSIYGQESNPTTWRLTRMNLALHGLDADFGSGPKDTFAEDLHPNLVGARGADFVLANPPFNLKAWNTNPDANQGRWKYGEPPKNNANYAWLQHMLHHLKPGGVAGVVLDNGSLSSKSGGHLEIRERLVSEGVVKCIVALPGNLFYTTPIEACLWILEQPKAPTPHGTEHEILFIDARKKGELINRTTRTLDDVEIGDIATTYHSWRAGNSIKHMPGWCKTSKLAEIKSNGFLLNPGLYVGASPDERTTMSWSAIESALVPRLMGAVSDWNAVNDARDAALRLAGLPNLQGIPLADSVADELLKGLFQSWFVDFDPVIGASNNMPAEVRALFPTRMDETIANIPEGWQVTSVGRIATAKNTVITGPFGTHLHASDYSDEGVPLVLVKNVVDGKFVDRGMPKVRYEKANELTRYLLKKGDIVFTRVGAVGRSALVTSHEEGWMISGQMLRVRLDPQGPLNPAFLARAYLDQSFISHVEAIALGSTRPSLNTGIVQSLPIVVPPKRLQDLFVSIVEGILGSRRLNEQMTALLSEARATSIAQDKNGE